MLSVYLINNSVGLAGIERRFANIWSALKQRGNVRPILVVPDTLADILSSAGLVDRSDELLWTVREQPGLRAMDAVRNRIITAATARIRDHALARAYGRVWKRIEHDSNAVLHIGYDSPALKPPLMPTVYECVDSTLAQLDRPHFRRAARRRSIIHCQTHRIRSALERTMADRQPVWTTVTSPCYFADYSSVSGASVSKDPNLLAFVGRFSAEKNPLMFVEAISVVRGWGFDCRGILLGDGPMLGEVLKRVAELELGSVVEVAFTPKPLDWISSASVFVTLQNGDNYGSQSLLEAMGAGCAVIASNVGETARIVTPDVGILIETGVMHLAQAIADLLADRQRAADLGRRASHVARSTYTADAYAAFLETLYASAVERFHESTDYGT